MKTGRSSKAVWNNWFVASTCVFETRSTDLDSLRHACFIRSPLIRADFSPTCCSGKDWHSRGGSGTGLRRIRSAPTFGSSRHLRQRGFPLLPRLPNRFECSREPDLTGLKKTSPATMNNHWSIAIHKEVLNSVANKLIWKQKAATVTISGPVSRWSQLAKKLPAMVQCAVSESRGNR